jgi:hypothetical protein
LHGIVHRGLQADAVRLHAGSRDTLTSVIPEEIGDKCFKHKDAVVSEMLCDSDKTAHLVVLGEQPKKGVEDHQDQPKATLDSHVSEIPDSHGDVLPAGLCTQLGDHPWGRIDAVHLEPTLGQRQGNASRANPQLQDRPASG